MAEYAAAAAARPARRSLEQFTIGYLQQHVRPRGISLIVQLEPSPPAPPGTRATLVATPGTEALRAAPRVAGWLRRPPSAPEVGRLSRTVDGMLDRLETVFRHRAELLADVSHQLRTPLTIVRGHLDVLSRTGYGDPEEVSETVAVVIDELDQLALMVERMLLLGQALERGFLIEETVDLQDLLGDVLEASRFLGDRDWELGSVPAIAIRGDRAKLRGALLNLLRQRRQGHEAGRSHRPRGVGRG